MYFILRPKCILLGKSPLCHLVLSWQRCILWWLFWKYLNNTQPVLPLCMKGGSQREWADNLRDWVITAHSLLLHMLSLEEREEITNPFIIKRSSMGPEKMAPQSRVLTALAQASGSVPSTHHAICNSSSRPSSGLFPLLHQMVYIQTREHTPERIFFIHFKNKKLKWK